MNLFPMYRFKQIGMLFLFLLFLCSAQANVFAHSSLVQMSPAGGAQLQQSPDAIEVWFNDPVVVHSRTFTLTDEQGVTYPVDNIAVDRDNPVHVTGYVQKLPAGTYTVQVHVIALDGDSITEQYTFEIVEQEPQNRQLHIVKQAPADGQIVSGSPSTIDLWFNQEAQLSAIGLFDKDGKTIPLQVPQYDPENPNHITVDVTETLEAGTYQVTWYASPKEGPQASINMMDVFYFAVDEFTPMESAGQKLPMKTGIPQISVKSIGYWFSLLGFTLLFGAALLTAGRLDTPIRRKRWRHLSLLLSLFVIGGTVIQVVQFRFELSNIPLHEFALLKFVFIPVVQSLLVLIGVWMKRVSIYMYLAALMLLPFATGHAFYPRYTGAASIAASYLHVLASSIWFGGLFALIAVPSKEDRAEWMLRAGPVFSKWALWSILTLTFTGTILVFSYIPSFTFTSLLQSKWGQAVVMKAVLTACVIWLGYGQRRRIQRIAASFAACTRWGVYECLFGLLILLFASTLLITSPSAAEQGIYAKHDRTDEVTLRISPLYPGENVISAAFTDEWSVVQTDITVSMPPQYEVNYRAFRTKENTFAITGNVLHAPGTVTIRVQALLQGGDMKTYEYTVVVPGELRWNE